MGFFIILAILVAYVGAMIVLKILGLIVGGICYLVTEVIDGEKIDET